LKFMRLLVVTTFSDRSETAVYAGLARRGHEIAMLCHQGAAQQESLRAAGIHVETYAMGHHLDVDAWRRIRHLLADRRPEVLYAPWRHIALCLQAVRGTPTAMMTYRGTLGHLHRWDPFSHLTFLHPRIRRIACASEAVRHYLLGLGLPRVRLVTVYRGHDPAWYDELPCPSRTELGLPEDAFLVGHTGRIRPVKGAWILLQALARLPRELNVHVVLLGHVADARVRRLAARSDLRDRVHLLGYRPAGAAIARRFDVFAMPSVAREGFGRAAVEAMCQHVPPVVSRVGGLPELVEDGVSGLVVPPKDPAALADAIAELVRDPVRRRALGEGARARIAEQFNVADTILAMERFFAGE
jgi:glycosyltransferase involved in cell wall biosynthesis